MSAPPYTLGWVHNLETAPASSDARGIIALAVVFPLVAVLCVGFKFTIRLRTIGSVGWDDVALAISCGLNIGYSATAIYQTKWGLGLNAADFPPENAVPFSRTQFAGGPLYCLTVLGFKLSLLISYLRVAGFNRTYATIVWVVIVSVVISQIIFTILLSAGCRPIAKQWDPSIPGKCINALPAYFALGGTSLGWDLIIIILPFPILRRLQLDWQRKVALLAVFSLGFFVTIVQAIRLTSIAKLATYTDSKGSIQWSAVEINPRSGCGMRANLWTTGETLWSKGLTRISIKGVAIGQLVTTEDKRKSQQTPSRHESQLERRDRAVDIHQSHCRRCVTNTKLRDRIGDDDDGKQSASQSVHEQQIRVQRDVTVRMDDGGIQHV
ncbi:unnamed protein product, partial [Aureobasidium pullulans]